MCGAPVAGVADAAVSGFCGSDCATAIGPLEGALQPRHERRRPMSMARAASREFACSMTLSSGMTRQRLSRRSGVAGGGSPVQEFVEIARMDIPGEKLRVVQDLVMHGNVRLDTADLGLAESDAHT